MVFFNTAQINNNKNNPPIYHLFQLKKLYIYNI